MGEKKTGENRRRKEQERCREYRFTPKADFTLCEAEKRKILEEPIEGEELQIER